MNIPTVEQVVIARKALFNDEETFTKVHPITAKELLRNEYGSSARYAFREATEEEYEQFAAKVQTEQPLIRCHRGESFLQDITFWEKREDGLRHCSYCGSFHPDDLANALQANTARLGGSDWKYGYPHKFYVYPMGKPGSIDGKFYTRHLLDLSDEDFSRIAPLVSAASGIEFVRDEQGEMMYRAPYHGFQR